MNTIQRDGTLRKLTKKRKRSPKKRLACVGDEPNRNCFYCGAIVWSRQSMGDHFPTPFAVGGSTVVPACESCHHMKDNFSFKLWPSSWVSKVVADFPLLSRETKIFLAKAIRIIAEHYCEYDGLGQS